MTNKIQKIREGIEKLKSNLIHGACSSQIAMETRCKEEAYNEVLAILDSMQEEPVSEDFKEFEVEYIEREKDNIICVYDRHAGLVDGAKWQKEQMMKDAVDGEIKVIYRDAVEAESVGFSTQKTGLFEGDKVKLIIIKED